MQQAEMIGPDVPIYSAFSLLIRIQSEKRSK